MPQPPQHTMMYDKANYQLPSPVYNNTYNNHFTTSQPSAAHYGTERPMQGHEQHTSPSHYNNNYSFEQVSKTKMGPPQSPFYQSPHQHTSPTKPYYNDHHGAQFSSYDQYHHAKSTSSSGAVERLPSMNEFLAEVQSVTFPSSAALPHQQQDNRRKRPRPNSSDLIINDEQPTMKRVIAHTPPSSNKGFLSSPQSTFFPYDNQQHVQSSFRF